MAKGAQKRSIPTCRALSRVASAAVNGEQSSGKPRECKARRPSCIGFGHPYKPPWPAWASISITLPTFAKRDAPSNPIPCRWRCSLNWGVLMGSQSISGWFMSPQYAMPFPGGQLPLFDTSSEKLQRKGRSRIATKRLQLSSHLMRFRAGDFVSIQSSYTCLPMAIH